MPYWSQDAAAVSAALGSGPGGLSSERAAAQLHLVGPNSVEEASHLSALRLLLRQFESPLVLILIFAAVISLVLQQWVDSAIILVIVLASTLLGFFQEYRASAAVEELKRRLALTCRVRVSSSAGSVTVPGTAHIDTLRIATEGRMPKSCGQASSTHHKARNEAVLKRFSRTGCHFLVNLRRPDHRRQYRLLRQALMCSDCKIAIRQQPISQTSQNLLLQ